jgi:hypothetical protein
MGAIPIYIYVKRTVVKINLFQTRFGVVLHSAHLPLFTLLSSLFSFSLSNLSYGSRRFALEHSPTNYAHPSSPQSLQKFLNRILKMHCRALI